MNKSDLLIPSWVDHEMQNWARWSLSAEYPGRPDWPGPRMARDLIPRFYRAPDWGDDVRPLPPNEADAAVGAPDCGCRICASVGVWTLAQWKGWRGAPSEAILEFI